MSETEKRILDIAEKEFLDRGFQKTSMRRIAALAGVTTGALYGYFKSKEEIFDALVFDEYSSIMSVYRKAHEDFAALPFSKQLDGMGEITMSCMNWCVDYIYSNFKAFRLLIIHSEGTRYSTMIDEMMEIEEDATEAFMERMKENGIAVAPVDPLLEHMITSGYFESFFEIVRHSIPKSEALEYIKNLQAFYKAGWMRLFGME